MDQFSMPTSLLCGADALSALGDHAVGRVMILTDPFLAKSPLMSRVREELTGRPTLVFDRVQPDPDVAAVASALSAFMEFSPDVLVAVGGGSPMDTAKAVRKLAAEQGLPLAGGLIAVPTTAGSGSEVTSFAVVTDSGKNTKLPMNSPDMVPELAILDPLAVVSCPQSLTANSGMDALSHALEAYVARGHNDFSDALAIGAMKLIFDHLLTTHRHGDDVVARHHMQNAATMAAMAFENSGLGIVHGLSHAIGGTFAVPHGRLNAILMPAVVRFNAGVSDSPGGCDFRGGAMTPTARRYADLARAIGVQATTERGRVTALTAVIIRLREALGMPDSMLDAGVKAHEFEAVGEHLASRALADFCTGGNPVAPGIAEMRALLAQVTR